MPQSWKSMVLPLKPRFFRECGQKAKLAAAGLGLGHSLGLAGGNKLDK